MVTDERLKAMLAAAADAERAIRLHVSETRGQAAEQGRGLAAYRHVVALRRSLEEWVETRAYRAAEPTTT